MNIRIKQMEICKNLSSLKSWIGNELTEKEKITFFVEEDCEEDFKITATKKGIIYTIKLGTEVFGEQEDIELFDGFADMLQVDNLKDIPVYKINLEVI